MRFTIQKSQIAPIINNLQSFLQKKDKSQITSHILLEAKKGEITLKATNYEMGLSVRFKDENIDTEGRVTANGAALNSFINSLKDDKITFSREENALRIQQNKSQNSLDIFDANEFPKFPENYEKARINIESQTIINALKRISPVIEGHTPKAELQNALIDIKDSRLNFVASDAKRLEVISVSHPSTESLNFMFPKNAIGEIHKLFANDSASFYFIDGNIIVESDRYTFFTRIPNGSFPPYESIIPKDPQIKHRIQLNREKMQDALKVIAANCESVILTFTKDSIHFQSYRSEDNSRTSDEIEIEREKNATFIESIGEEEITICFSIKHLQTFLQYIETPHFEMQINENYNAQHLLKSESDKTKKFILVAMPILL